VNAPLSLLFFYLVLGMITKTSAFASMPDEIESAIGMEEEDVQPALRAFLTVLFVLCWPMVLVDLIRR
jgi:hypothetical protein